MDTVFFTSSWYLAARNLFITLLATNFLLSSIALLDTVSFDEPITRSVLLLAIQTIKQLLLYVLPCELLFILILVSGGYIEARGDAHAIIFHKPYALFGRTQVVPLAAIQSVTLIRYKSQTFSFQQQIGKQIGVSFDFLPDEVFKRFAAFLRAHAITPVNF